MFTNPTLDEIKSILLNTKHIAVVGLSPNPKRPSFQVSRALQSFGYSITPVRPLVKEVLGQMAYDDIRDIPHKIDLVDVFRAPEHIAPIVDRCIELQIPVLWLQDGVVNEVQAVRAQQAGIIVVMDRCTYRDYVNLVDPSVNT